MGGWETGEGRGWEQVRLVNQFAKAEGKTCICGYISNVTRTNAHIFMLLSGETFHLAPFGAAEGSSSAEMYDRENVGSERERKAGRATRRDGSAAGEKDTV